TWHQPTAMSPSKARRPGGGPRRTTERRSARFSSFGRSRYAPPMRQNMHQHPLDAPYAPKRSSSARQCSAVTGLTVSRGRRPALLAREAISGTSPERAPHDWPDRVLPRDPPEAGPGEHRSNAGVDGLRRVGELHVGRIGPRGRRPSGAGVLDRRREERFADPAPPEAAANVEAGDRPHRSTRKWLEPWRSLEERQLAARRHLAPADRTVS